MNREVNHRYDFEIHKHIFKYVVDYISFAMIRSVSQKFTQQTLHGLSSQTVGVFVSSNSDLAALIIVP